MLDIRLVVMDPDGQCIWRTTTDPRQPFSNNVTSIRQNVIGKQKLKTQIHEEENSISKFIFRLPDPEVAQFFFCRFIPSSIHHCFLAGPYQVS